MTATATAQLTPDRTYTLWGQSGWTYLGFTGHHWFARREAPVGTATLGDDRVAGMIERGTLVEERSDG